jgi:hypothetical protein
MQRGSSPTRNEIRDPEAPKRGVHRPWVPDLRVPRLCRGTLVRDTQSSFQNQRSLTVTVSPGRTGAINGTFWREVTPMAERLTSKS